MSINSLPQLKINTFKLTPRLITTNGYLFMKVSNIYYTISLWLTTKNKNRLSREPIFRKCLCFIIFVGLTRFLKSFKKLTPVPNVLTAFDMLLETTLGIKFHANILLDIVHTDLKLKSIHYYKTHNL